MQLRSRFAVLAACTAWASTALAQSVSTTANSICPARFDEAPVIDGRTDEAMWTQAARLDGFRQVQPGDNIEPSRRTDVLIGYDRRALYLAFRADDTSTGVRATIARRDAIEDDDIVGVYLDTFQDHRRAYYIFFNPYGIQADGIYTEGAAEPDLTVDLVIASKGTIDSGGYTVEAAIPFASLRYRSGQSPVFGLHVQRFIRRDRNEQISWMPLSRTDRVCSIRPGGWASSPTSAKGDSSSSSAPSSARRLDRRRRPAFTRDKSIPSRAFAKRCLEGMSRLAR